MAPGISALEEDANLIEMVTGTANTRPAGSKRFNELAATNVVLSREFVFETTELSGNSLIVMFVPAERAPGGMNIASPDDNVNRPPICSEMNEDV